jgi:hypothetical protein
MPWFTVKSRWTDQTQQGDGGGSGAATVRASAGTDDSGMIPVSLRDDAADVVQGARDRLSCAGSGACREAVRNALGVDLATEEGKAVFWSGGERAQRAAELYAEQTGGYTEPMKLASTERGRLLLDQIADLPTGQQRVVWEIVSGRFALGASGDLQVFLSTQANQNAIFYRVEQPILNFKESFGTAQLTYHWTSERPSPQYPQGI